MPGEYLPGGMLANSNDPSSLTGIDNRSLGPEAKQHNVTRPLDATPLRLSLAVPETRTPNEAGAGTRLATRTSMSTGTFPVIFSVSFMRSTDPNRMDLISYSSGR